MLQTVEYGGGSLLSYSECGDKEGFPVLVQHGMIASITDYQLFRRLAESRVRVISIARPGYGESSPYQMSNLGEWGELVAVLIRKLGVSQFDVLGMSSGAPYSYAIAHKLLDRARNVFVFSGIPALYDERVQALWPFPMNKQASLPELQRVAKEVFFPNVSPAALRRDDVQDSMRNDCFGIAQDLRLRCLDWGFDLSEVQVPVYMQHARDDGIPLRTAEITAHLLPNCHLDIRESGGHFSDELLDAFIETTMLPHYESHRA